MSNPIPQSGPLPELGPRDALIVVDLQNDFCPGGELAVPGGDEIVPLVNRWIRVAVDGGAKIVASRDWHPADHVSFRERGGPWPPHCIRGSLGAEFHPQLRLPEETWQVLKGDDRDRDQYSAFDGTGLADRLREAGVERVWVCGLALDVCVRATAMDAMEDGWETHLIRDATRAVGPRAEAGVETLGELADAGVIVA